MIGTEAFGSGPSIESISPVDGKVIASLTSATEDEYERVITAAHEAFLEWRNVPARGTDADDSEAAHSGSAGLSVSPRSHASSCSSSNGVLVCNPGGRAGGSSAASRNHSVAAEPA